MSMNNRVLDEFKALCCTVVGLYGVKVDDTTIKIKVENISVTLRVPGLYRLDQEEAWIEDWERVVLSGPRDFVQREFEPFIYRHHQLLDADHIMHYNLLLWKVKWYEDYIQKLIQDKMMSVFINGPQEFDMEMNLIE